MPPLPAVAPVARCWAVGTLGPGSAGASTLAVALAGHLEGLLLEADADGGVLGTRYGGWLNERAPSLASLLAALHSPGGPGELEHHLQRLPAGARAVLVPPDTDHAIGPVRRLAEDLDALRRCLPGEVLVLDVGRVRPDTPSLDLAEQADGLVAVVRPHVDSLGCLLARLPSVLQTVPRLLVAVRGDGPYPLGDIRAAIHMSAKAVVPVVPVPEDPRAVMALNQMAKARPQRGRGGQRGGLAQAVSTVVSAMGDLAAAPSPWSGPSGGGARLDVGAGHRARGGR